jgi:hypothetical protein
VTVNIKKCKRKVSPTIYLIIYSYSMQRAWFNYCMQTYVSQCYRAVVCEACVCRQAPAVQGNDDHL